MADVTDIELDTDCNQNDPIISADPEAFFADPLINFTQAYETVEFLKNFSASDKVWTLTEFMIELDRLYELTRIRFTKGGHKTNQDNKMRQSFIC